MCLKGACRWSPSSSSRSIGPSPQSVNGACSSLKICVWRVRAEAVSAEGFGANGASSGSNARSGLAGPHGKACLSVLIGTLGTASAQPTGRAPPSPGPLGPSRVQVPGRAGSGVGGSGLTALGLALPGALDQRQGGLRFSLQ